MDWAPLLDRKLDLGPVVLRNFMTSWHSSPMWLSGQEETGLGSRAEGEKIPRTTHHLTTQLLEELGLEYLSVVAHLTLSMACMSLRR